MALIEPATETHKGPWHLDEPALKELYDLLTSELSRCRERIIAERAEWVGNKLERGAPDKADDADARSQLEQRFDSTHRHELAVRVVVEDAKGLKAEGASLEELRADVLVASMIPIKFSASLRDRYTEICEVALSKYASSGEVRITVAQEHGSFRYALRDWVVEHQASWPTRIWHAVGHDHLHWWLGWLVPFWMLLAAFPTVDATKAKAKELLASGITPGTLPDAVALLLKLEAGLGEKVLGPPNKALLVAAVSTTLLLVTLSYCPRSIVGIGAVAKRALERERQKARVGTVTIPVFVSTSVLWPFLWEKVQALF